MTMSYDIDYKTASQWLEAVKQDDLWQGQLQQLQNASPDELDEHRKIVNKNLEKSTAGSLWYFCQHRLEKVVEKLLMIKELTIANRHIQTVWLLSMEWLELHSKAGTTRGTKKPASKKKPAKPQKPRETMTFKLKSGVTEGHLTLLYQKLVKEGWIEGNDADFKALFSNKRDEDCVLIWKGVYGKGTLVVMFKQFVGAGLITVPNGFTIPAILEGHFKDSNDKWLTGLDKGNAANNKALPVINECVKLLKADPNILIYGDYDDDENFQLEYDPHDHQDLNLHKR